MSISIDQILIHTDDGRVHVGGSTLEDAVGLAREVEENYRHIATKITQGSSVLLEGDALSDALGD